MASSRMLKPINLIPQAFIVLPLFPKAIQCQKSTQPQSGPFDTYHIIVNAILISIGLLLFASSLLIAGIVAYSRIRGETSSVSKNANNEDGLPAKPMRRKDVAFYECQNERKERNVYNYRPDGHNQTLYEMALESHQENRRAVSANGAGQPEMRERATREGDLADTEL
ncbi:hypothetical protein SeLEV6574_g05308 [Synchytrium endobioticum]|uniref:Uncharacterized protein n=1 Tax=Synchytrium endobioticum TaxID=286115 RepID=A0A507CUY2_9FUNG|nr:hypothetical protein SeLEV6574_g05308 [Synchytrium endobioticum]